ncbi:hypothetical protein Tco_1407780 [Tanacetum coccineum]
MLCERAGGRDGMKTRIPHRGDYNKHLNFVLVARACVVVADSVATVVVVDDDDVVFVIVVVVNKSAVLCVKEVGIGESLIGFILDVVSDKFCLGGVPAMSGFDRRTMEMEEYWYGLQDCRRGLWKLFLVMITLFNKWNALAVRSKVLKTMKAPIFVYYQRDNFYRNHHRFRRNTIECKESRIGEQPIEVPSNVKVARHTTSFATQEKDSFELPLVRPSVHEKDTDNAVAFEQGANYAATGATTSNTLILEASEILDPLSNALFEAQFECQGAETWDEAAIVTMPTIKEHCTDIKKVHFLLFADGIHNVWVKKA